MYVKLFSTILSSSVWSAVHTTRIVWITMLAMADEEGVVRGSESGLAHQARVTAAECRAALKYLSEPDVESQSQEWGGRRIEAIEGGWLVLSYAKYREIRTQSMRDNAVRQRRFRAKKESGVTCVTVTTNEYELLPTSKVISASKGSKLNAVDAFERAWELYPKRAGGNSRALAEKAFTARVRAGVDPATIVAGVERYAAFIRATGKERTEFVKQAATFFGPNEWWAETWDLPLQPPDARQGVQQRSANALREMMERHPDPVQEQR